jgi:general secretion pathway protein K
MENLNLKMKIFIGIVAVVAIAVIGLYFYKESKNSYTNEDEFAIVTENEEIPEEEEEITIHIIGEVKYPGIVILKTGQRIIDAIDAAGGETEEADLNKINLAQLLSDGDKIYVPSINDNEIEEYKDTTSRSSTVNINTATLEELTSLPGIGESTAQRIIDYRKQNGKFKTIDDLKNVSGIGEGKFNNLKEKITAK